MLLILSDKPAQRLWNHRSQLLQGIEYSARNTEKGYIVDLFRWAWLRYSASMFSLNFFTDIREYDS